MNTLLLSKILFSRKGPFFNEKSTKEKVWKCMQDMSMPNVDVTDKVKKEISKVKLEK